MYNRKLDTLKLSSSDVDIHGELSLGGNIDSQCFIIKKQAFDAPVCPGYQNIRGILKNLNTIEVNTLHDVIACNYYSYIGIQRFR